MRNTLAAGTFAIYAKYIGTFAFCSEIIRRYASNVVRVDEFVQRISAEARARQLGDPLSEDVEQGPMVRPRLWSRYH